MSDYQSQGVLQRLGATAAVLFQHGEDAGRRKLAALALAAVMGASVTSGAFAKEPAPAQESGLSYSDLVKMVQDEEKYGTLQLVTPEGGLVTLTTDQVQPIEPAYANQLEKDLTRGIDIFERTRSWDLVMANVVAPGLKSADALERQSALGVLSFYHRAGERSGNGPTVPVVNNAADYIAHRGPLLERERQVAQALDVLDQTVRQMRGPVTEETLAAELQRRGGPDYDTLDQQFDNALPDGAMDLINRLQYFQEYTLSLQNQAEQYRTGNVGEMSPEVQAVRADLEQKYDLTLILDDYSGRPNGYSGDLATWHGGMPGAGVHDSFARSWAVQDALSGFEVANSVAPAAPKSTYWEHIPGPDAVMSPRG
ncbi:hypothetical protein [Pseudomonas sp.]|uniref:hypothetical protein n=1 Tax=Pseudomonas sp. TaxID=306 RepID=UPI00290DCD3D|nr:hypothetical protein [Pseudomonas sp.]MDU4255366.1 hypothetical protein [Pseudomonas sp.]